VWFAITERREAKLQNLITQLDQILVLLDDSAQNIAAIKVEEALQLLQEARQEEVRSKA